MIPFRFLNPSPNSIQTLSARLLDPLAFSSGSGGRGHLRRRFNWKYVCLDLVAFEKCYDYLNSCQSMLAGKVDCAPRVTKIKGFTKLPCPGSGTLKIK